MAKRFSEFFPKNCKITLFGQKNPNKAFLVPKLGFLFFAPNFAIRQIGGGWFQIWQYCSKFQPKIPKSGDFGPILKKDKLEDADFKYEYSIFKILAQRYPNQIFLIPNLGVFVFHPNISSRKIRGCCFQI